MLTTIILSTALIGCADISYTLKETTEDTGGLTAISGVQPQQTSETTTEVSQAEPSDEIEVISEDTAMSEEIIEDTGTYEDTALEEEQPDEIQDDWELFAESDFASGGLYPFATNACAGIGCPTISNGALYMAGDWNSITVDSSYGDWFASGTSWAVEIDIIDSADADFVYLRFASSPGHLPGNNQGVYGLIPVNGTPEITIQSQTTYRFEVDGYNGYLYENEALLSESNEIDVPSDGAQHIGIAFQRAPTNAQPTGTTISTIRVYSK